jgi:predicted transcriptional regulator
VSEHRDYFLEYDVSHLPYEFIERIGELEKGVYVPETLANLEEGENKIREAQEFTWILSDQVLSSIISTLAEKAKKPFDLRIVLPEGLFPPENKSRLPSTIPNLHKRVLSKVDVLVVMTEKYAVFRLPNRSGRIDYTGFSGNDPKFHKWCKDLFLHYWAQAKPLGIGRTH